MHESSSLNLNISGTMMSMDGHRSDIRGTGVAEFEENCPVVLSAKIIKIFSDAIAKYGNPQDLRNVSL